MFEKRNFGKKQIFTIFHWKVKLKLQENGNLEIFCENVSVWESNTTNDNVKFLYFDVHGNLVLLANDNSTVWSASIGPNAVKLLMQDDGNVVLYNDDDQSVWTTRTKDKCYSHKGLKLSFYKTRFGKVLLCFF